MRPIRDRRSWRLARELLALVAGWADGRTVYAVVDSAYAARPLLEGRPANVEVLSRLRPDAALWARPGPSPTRSARTPTRKGHRLPTPKAMAAVRRRWDPLPRHALRSSVTPLVFGCTALWYGALRDQPVRIVIVRDPSGRRRDEAFFCTDLTVDHAFILEGYARRWTIEVAFHDQKQFLGFEDPQNQTPEAVARTAPMAGLVYDLVLLWYAARVQQGLAPAGSAAPGIAPRPRRPSSTCSPPSARNRGASTFLTHRCPQVAPRSTVQVWSDRGGA